MSWDFSSITPPEPEPEAASEHTASMTSDPVKTLELKPHVVEALSSVFDPEIPVNIYELGLIYDVIIDATAVVGIRMTLTAPGCPAAQSLPVEVAYRVKAVPGVTDAKVDIVWDPPWDSDKMSDVAKLQLGLL
jgi:FeS assembly SUF system protein